MSRCGAGKQAKGVEESGNKGFIRDKCNQEHKEHQEHNNIKMLMTGLLGKHTLTRG